MGASRTRLQLERVTDFLAFERLCNAVMGRFYRDIEPLGGYKDKGRDALHYSRRRGVHTIFQYSVRRDWETKLREDLKKIQGHGHQCQDVVFISNQDISAGDRDRALHIVQEQYGWTLRLCGLERLATLIDDRGDELIRLYPEIFFLPAPGDRPFQPLDVPAFLEQVIRDHHVWEQRYTPLFADRFEFDLLYAESNTLMVQAPVDATLIPTLARISVLLGESGAGKTTTLWRLALAAAQARQAATTHPIPILVPLRNWSEHGNMFALIVNQFAAQGGHPAAIEGLLLRGDALLLLDGVNELPALPDMQEAAGRDLRSFLSQFPQVRTILTCRTSDYVQGFVDPGTGRPPVSYEAQRLTQEQIQDYVQRTLPPKPAASFLVKLGVAEADTWSDTATILHLARIPFHLRLLLSEFAVTGELPSSTAQLAQRLLQRLCQPRPGQRAPTVGARRTEQILSEVAGASLQAGGDLVMPVVLARDAVDAAVAHLHGTHALTPDTSADAIWADLLSENLLHHVRQGEGGVVTRVQGRVEWLHQLFRDYFLGVFLVSLSFDDQPRLRPTKIALRVAPSAFVVACAMALALAPTLARKRALFDEFRAFSDLRHALLRTLSFREVEEMLLDGVTNLFAQSTVREGDLQHAALYVHSPVLPELLVHHLKGQDLTTKRAIASTLSAYVIAFHGKHGVGRALQGMRALIAHQDDEIRFQAAKALWEDDRGLAAQTLEALADSGGAVAAQARDLLQEWQPE
jgi:NACHT domain